MRKGRRSKAELLWDTSYNCMFDDKAEMEQRKKTRSASRAAKNVKQIPGTVGACDPSPEPCVKDIKPNGGNLKFRIKLTKDMKKTQIHIPKVRIRIKPIKSKGKSSNSRSSLRKTLAKHPMKLYKPKRPPGATSLVPKGRRQPSITKKLLKETNQQPETPKSQNLPERKTLNFSPVKKENENTNKVKLPVKKSTTKRKLERLSATGKCDKFCKRVKKEPHSCVAAIRHVMSKFDFIQSVNSKTFNLQCRQFTPLIVKVQDKDDVLLERRYPSKTRCNSEIPVSYKDLLAAINLLNILLREEEDNLTIISVSNNTKGKPMKLELSFKSMLSFLIALLSQRVKALPSSFKVQFVYTLALNLKGNEIQTYRPKSEETDEDIVKFKVAFCIVVGETTPSSSSTALNKDLGSRKYHRHRLRGYEKIKVSCKVELDQNVLVFIEKQERDDFLKKLYLISLLFEHHIKQYIGNYPKQLKRQRIEEFKNRKKKQQIRKYKNNSSYENKRHLVYIPKSSCFSLKTYSIMARTKQLTPLAQERVNIEKQKELEEKRKLKLEKQKQKRKQIMRKTDELAEIDALADIRNQLLHQEDLLQKTSTEYFDYKNCLLPFTYVSKDKDSISTSLSSYKKFVLCNNLVEFKDQDTNQLCFVSKASTSRLSIIESSRMQQTGVRLNYPNLSPLLFRIEVDSFSISPRILSALNKQVMKLLFGARTVACHLLTSNASHGSMISKCYVNSWKAYLDCQNSDTSAESQTKQVDKEESSVLDHCVGKLAYEESFVFAKNLNLKFISEFTDLQNLFDKANSFICLHYKMIICDERRTIQLIPIDFGVDIDREASYYKTDKNLNKLRSCDVKLAFLVRKTYGHDKTITFLRRSFDNYISTKDFTSFEGSAIFTDFEKEFKKQWDNNLFVRFDLFVSKKVWETKVKQRVWLKNQLQTTVSIFESHISVIFKKWASENLLKQVIKRNYQRLRRLTSEKQEINKFKSELANGYKKYLALPKMESPSELLTMSNLNIRTKSMKKDLSKLEHEYLDLSVSKIVSNMIDSCVTTQKIKKYQTVLINWNDKDSSSSASESKEEEKVLLELVQKVSFKRGFLLHQLYTLFSSNSKQTKLCNKVLFSSLKALFPKEDINQNLDNLRLDKGFELRIPKIFTATRDGFAMNTVAYDSTNNKLLSEGELKQLLKNCCPQKSNENMTTIDWCFDTAYGIPDNYVARKCDKIVLEDGRKLFKVGVRTYVGCFSEREFTEIENETNELYRRSTHSRTYKRQLEILGLDNNSSSEDEVTYFNDNTAHHVFNKRRCTRTKMFFNYRYLWTKEEMKHKNAKIAHGIRSDPSRIPKWMISRIQDPLTAKGIIKKRLEGSDEVHDVVAGLINEIESEQLNKLNGYKPIEMNVNSFAVNIYHDGSIGLSQHFDDAKRFRANIVSMRLFSDSRLSFDCKYFGCVNGKFTVDMPRGSLQVLDNDSYAGKVVTHCIKPGDMMGKSGVLLLREIQPDAVKAADIFLVSQAVEAFAKLSFSEKSSC